MRPSQDNPDSVRKDVVELFSGYRAEWLADRVFRLFTEPAYFPQLVTSDPCVLVGGRGTGKTTALKCLSYEGLYALGSHAAALENWPYFGLYYRVNTNRVSAFQGSEISAERWATLFGHYINLDFCDLVLRFLEWFGAHVPAAPKLSVAAIHRVALSLRISDVTSQSELVSALELTRLSFEAAINNIGDSTPIPLVSIQGGPIDQLLREVKALPQFRDKLFYFLIDEYENFDSLQQRVVNTLVKHCGDLYTFKIAVREFGLRDRSTLRTHEQLMHPADYKLIDITEELIGRGKFSTFAAEVCNVRLRTAFGETASPDVRQLLPEITTEDEAVLLGAENVTKDLRAAVYEQIPKERLEWVKRKSALELYTLKQRAEAEGASIADKLSAAWNDESGWRIQYDNYKYSYLFTLRRRKRGIRKYYCGWNVFTLLAAGNIRFILELVDEAFTRHFASDMDLSEPVSPDNQTIAAHATGNKNLRELEGLALSGAKLTRLLLGLGRVFQVMAENPDKHAPEVNQFHLDSVATEPAATVRINELLSEGVTHLALVRRRANKLQEDSDIRQWDYAVHPIFAPFFGFSHRRKRKLHLSDNELLGLIDRPANAIRSILLTQHRTDVEELPEQMQLFASYYALPN